MKLQVCISINGINYRNILARYLICSAVFLFLTLDFLCLSDVCLNHPFRLEFSRTQHHATAQVFSSSSPVPVLSCSTKEWAVKKELASTSCVAACQAVGEVLAHRCQQAGITRMVYRAIPWTYRSDAVSACSTNSCSIICLFFLI